MSGPFVIPSVMAAVLFFVIASPFTYGIVQSLLGGLVTIASSSGAPTLAGLVAHSVVYGLISFGLMHIKKKQKYY